MRTSIISSVVSGFIALSMAACSGASSEPVDQSAQAEHAGVTAPSTAPTLTKEKGRIVPEGVELVVAPAAIERALSVYEQLQSHDLSVLSQARQILTEHIFGMVDQGEVDEQRLTVGGLAQLKAVERDHAIKSAHAETKKRSRPNAVRTSRKVSA